MCAAGREPESFLAIDVGSTITQALLIDRVEGSYRFIGRGEAITTLDAPEVGLLAGIREAVRALEAVIGRVILVQDTIVTPEDTSGRGVDGCVITTSATGRLRVAVGGISHDGSVQRAVRAVRTTYALADPVVAADVPGKRRRCRWVAPAYAVEGDDVIALLRRLVPDAVLLAGGTEGGAIDLVEELAALVQISNPFPGRTWPVLFVGNSAARSRMTDLLGATTDLRVGDNLFPLPEDSNLTNAVEMMSQLYRQQRLSTDASYGSLSRWSRVPIETTANTFAAGVRFLARQYNLTVLAVDVGGLATTLCLAGRGDGYPLVRADLGLAYSCGDLLKLISPDRVARWLPSATSTTVVRDSLFNKRASPTTLPQTAEDLLIEQATAREAIQLALADLYPGSWYGGVAPAGHPPRPLRVTEVVKSKEAPGDLDLIIGAGGVVGRGATAGRAALILLDAIQPRGVAQLAVDPAGLLTTLGALAALHPIAAGQVLERDGLIKLGTAISAVGRGKVGKTAVRLSVRFADGRTLKVEVPFGTLEVIPLRANERVTLELRPAAGIDIGLGVAGQAAQADVEGGSVGIILDCRGRPLPIPKDVEERQKRMQEWLRAVGG